jgi:hypothetical protein
VEKQERVRKTTTRAAVTHWVLISSMQSGEARRSFLRRLIDLSTQANRMDHFVRLNKEARSDLEWWYQFCEEWNRVAMMQGPNLRCLRGVGLRGILGDKLVHAVECPVRECHITVQELVPIVIAAAVWGKAWQGKTVQVWCDNQAVISIINRGSSHNKDAMWNGRPHTSGGWTIAELLYPRMTSLCFALCFHRPTNHPL